MASRELLNGLPYRLRLRFDSLGGYVSSIVDQEEENAPS